MPWNALVLLGIPRLASDLNVVRPLLFFVPYYFSYYFWVFPYRL